MNIEKKNKLRLVLLAVLVLTTGGLLFYMQKPEADLIDPSLFKIEGMDKIDRVVMESKKGRIDLHFNGSRWSVNNKMDADQQLMDVLFATIEQAKPKREVGKTISKEVTQQLSTDGVTISWMEGDVLKKKFIAGGNEQKTEAYFQQSDGKSYVMTIPGYRVYVSGIFEIEEGMWRDKRVFNFNWPNFRGLEVKFPSSPDESYEILIKNAQFHIDGISKVDTTKVNEYLDGAFQLNAKEFLSAQKRAPYDSILKTAPAFVVEVKDIANRTYLLEVYPPQAGQEDVLGRIGGSEVAVFERSTIISLARRRNYFQQK